MNQREKVLAAVTRLLESYVALEQAETAVECKRLDRQNAEADLARVLKAVYGDRSTDGVIYKGLRYYLDDEGELAWQSMAAEVLV